MVRRTLTLLAALLAVAALGTTPAHAGGPTSVLLSSPPHVVALGYEDPAYNELQQLTETGAPSDEVDGEVHSSGRFVRATWLIHDMTVWRIDIIYPDAPGGPWIATGEFFDGTRPASLAWHRAAEPVRLVRLLDSFKLLSGKSYGGPTILDDVPAPAPPATVEPAADQPQPVAQAQVASTGVFTGWRWIIPGVLVGAAITILAVRLLPKRRWELIDVE